jgi:tRNA 2-selenouridine synthase
MLTVVGGILVRTFATTFATTTNTAAAMVVVRRRPDTTTDYKSLFLSNAPMMDVRAPVEFDQGSFPLACNIPLLTDEERHQVGICYKEHGQDAAIELGHELVHGEVKATRLKLWTDFCRDHPDHGYLYCFRGGLRSNTVQQWIKEETGITYPLVTGGYKAMRTFLMKELDLSMDPKAAELIVVCGKTGSGKTLVMEQLDHIHCSLDLEGLAHHRGSSFGAMPHNPDQPSQIDFENSISIAVLKLLNADADPVVSDLNGNVNGNVPSKKRIFVEDESKRIGRVTLPPALSHRMETCDGIVVVEMSVEERAQVIVQDYVIDLRERFVAIHGMEQGVVMHREFMLAALKRIRNRLGGERYEKIKATMEAAFQEEQVSGDMTLASVWVTDLLVGYYDKMYDYQLAQRKSKVLFRGSRDEVVEWARATTMSV